MTRYFNNLNLISIAYKWRKHLVIATLIAGIAAAFFSSPLFIQPRFSSMAVVYPSNIQPYSQESNSEQMLQLFQSRDIQDSLIRTFNLYQHYKINPKSAKAYYVISRYYDRFVSIRKTAYESVEVKAMDTDSTIACKMVNAILSFYNRKVSTLQREKYGEIYRLRHETLLRKEREIDSLSTLLKELSAKYELVNVDQQTEQMVKGYLRTFDGANRTSVNTPAVLNLKKQIETKGALHYLINEQFRRAVSTLGDLKVKEDDALADYKRDYTFYNVVTAPYPSQKKAYPIRWIIVLAAMTITLITSIMVLIVIENKETLSAAIITDRN
ncbi:MAG: hypothetical protein HXX14_03400 [Bacteroidetes bacterium]|nr:hypothetical protein [Bacteroidota bacterium]